MNRVPMLTKTLQLDYFHRELSFLDPAHLFNLSQSPEHRCRHQTQSKHRPGRKRTNFSLPSGRRRR